MKNNRFQIARIPTRRAFVVFSLSFLVVLLTTLSCGLLWCQPASNASAADNSPIGTWISADAWEQGDISDETVVEFTEAGLMNIPTIGFSALYRYDGDQLQILDIGDEGFLAAAGSSDTPQFIPGSYKCIITGDHMLFYGHIYGIHTYHGKSDLIRISGETGLSQDELAECIGRI